MERIKKVAARLKGNRKVEKIRDWLRINADRELFKVSSIAVFIIFNVEIFFLLFGIFTGEYAMFLVLGTVIFAAIVIFVLTFFSIAMAKKVEDFIFR